MNLVYFQLNLVALNQPHTGLMQGLNGADRMCFEQAKAMGLPFHYRAFISSPRQDLVNVVHHRYRDTLPVTNLRVSLGPGRARPEEPPLVVTRGWEENKGKSREYLLCELCKLSSWTDFCWSHLLFSH